MNSRISKTANVKLKSVTFTHNCQRQTQLLWYHCCPQVPHVTNVMESSSGPLCLTQAGRNRVPRDTCVTLHSVPLHLLHLILCVGVPSMLCGNCLSFTLWEEYSSLKRCRSGHAISSMDISAKICGERVPFNSPSRRLPLLGFLRFAILLRMHVLYLDWLDL